jgi:hypothetical protein
LEIVENQKENVVGRKKLAEQTRGTLFLSYRRTTKLTVLRGGTEFKKVPDEDKGPAFKTLLKGPSLSPHLSFRTLSFLPAAPSPRPQRINLKSTPSLDVPKSQRAHSGAFTNYSQKLQIHILYWMPPS